MRGTGTAPFLFCLFRFISRRHRGNSSGILAGSFWWGLKNARNCLGKLTLL